MANKNNNSQDKILRISNGEKILTDKAENINYDFFILNAGAETFWGTIIKRFDISREFYNRCLHEIIINAVNIQKKYDPNLEKTDDNFLNKITFFDIFNKILNIFDMPLVKAFKLDNSIIIMNSILQAMINEWKSKYAEINKVITEIDVSFLTVRYYDFSNNLFYKIIENKIVIKDIENLEDEIVKHYLNYNEEKVSQLLKSAMNIVEQLNVEIITKEEIIPKSTKYILDDVIKLLFNAHDSILRRSYDDKKVIAEKSINKLKMLENFKSLTNNRNNLKLLILYGKVIPAMKYLLSYPNVYSSEEITVHPICLIMIMIDYLNLNSIDEWEIELNQSKDINQLKKSVSIANEPQTPNPINNYEIIGNNKTYGGTIASLLLFAGLGAFGGYIIHQINQKYRDYLFNALSGMASGTVAADVMAVNEASGIAAGGGGAMSELTKEERDKAIKFLDCSRIYPNCIIRPKNS
ncbi:hypothetical protein [Arsenophonus sp.]|uniref:hypothetical protein n=1 Tax=Arsenophonus sp. TaxID=1872640 RepID=UPI00387A0017